MSACARVCTCTHEVVWDRVTPRRGHGPATWAEGELWGGHREAAGLSHKPRAPRPDPSWIKHLRGCRPRPWPRPCKAGEAELGHFRYKEAYLLGFTILWARRGPSQVGGVRSALHTAQERQGTWGSLCKLMKLYLRVAFLFKDPPCSQTYGKGGCKLTLKNNSCSHKSVTLS